MDIERERGITIKLQPVRMVYQRQSAVGNEQPASSMPNANSQQPSSEYILNLIDTPGHVDFSYEVSRTLACVEGIILLVDASQGIQAQTLANLHLAQQRKLTIIPVVNKIDLASAEPQKTAQEIKAMLGLDEQEILFVSGKTGQGVPALLEAVVRRIPPPAGSITRPFKSLIFDSVYDSFRGVVVFVRVFDGELTANHPIDFLRTGRADKALEVGHFKPQFSKAGTLQAGEIGYIVTGLKEVAEARVGDTIVSHQPAIKSLKPQIMSHKAEPISGYVEPSPMVFASFHPTSGEDFPKLRQALLKLKLSDASLVFAPEQSAALGPGFRIGFLGLLHLEIVKERLEREYDLRLVITTPHVDYHGAEGGWEEPWIKMEIISPAQYIGPLMEIARERRAEFKDTTYLSETRVLLTFAMPLSEMIVDFYDRVKSVSSGYASVSYELLEYRPGDLVRLNIIIAGEKADAFSSIIHRSKAQQRGREMVERLKSLIPKQLFEVRLQAALGGKIIASETIPALRKDVTAKLYGGDVTRKRKLLEKQKEGKKKMKRLGSVDIPTDIFLQLLRR